MNKLSAVLTNITLISLIAGCAALGPFSPRTGMSVNEVSRAAYVPCAGFVNPDANQLVLIGKHPEASNVDIYRTVAHTKFKRGAPECRKDLYFFEGRLISNTQLEEIKSTGTLITKHESESETDYRDLDSIKKKLSEKLKLKKTEITKNNSDYLTLSEEGTFSLNCNTNSIKKSKNYSIQRVVKRNQDTRYKGLEYDLLSRSEKGDRQDISIITKDESTGLYTEIINSTYKDNQINYFLIVKDDYVRMILLNSTKDKIAGVLTKCSNSLTKNTFVEPSDSQGFSIPDSNPFEIKDLIIGEKLTNDKCKKGLITMQTFEGKTMQKCSFDTTILEVPYEASAYLINSKIVSVEFEALHVNTGKNNSVYANSGYERMFDELRIPDGTIEKHVETIVDKIKQKLGEPRVSKKVVIPDEMNEKCQISESPNALNALFDVMCNGPIKEYKAKLKTNCGKCDLTEYVFSWEDKYKVKVFATVPKYKKTPGAYSNIAISYTSKENAKELEDYMQRRHQDVIRAQNHENYKDALLEFSKKLTNKVNNDF